MPIALSILLASEQIECDHIDQFEFAGELSLCGDLRHTPGLLPFALGMRDTERTLIVPEHDAPEAALVDNLKVLGARNLLSVCRHLTGDEPLASVHSDLQTFSISGPNERLCLSDIAGQAQAKRALEIAASGHHSLLMMGPPGTGKTMLASRLNTLLPILSMGESIEVAAIASISQGGFDVGTFRQRPFRRPHHTASPVSLVGGGRHPKPGEISLAHRGILFLDELPEFDRKVLEVLREPLESGRVNLSRAQGQAEYPAQCLLVAAMNPCPCGYLGDTVKACSCREEQIKRYRHKISGPLLDRIDLQIEVPRLAKGQLSQYHQSIEPETSDVIKKRIAQTRNVQLGRSDLLNAQYSPKEIKAFCTPTSGAQQLLDNAMERLGLSARAYHRILKIARTLADMAQEKTIDRPFIAEAIQYRQLDRTLG